MLKLDARPFNHYRESSIDGWVVLGILQVILRLNSMVATVSSIGAEAGLVSVAT